MPNIMKLLGIVGTVAMFIVGGGIFSHHFHFNFLSIEIIQNTIVGVIVGMASVAILSLISKLKITKKA